MYDIINKSINQSSRNLLPRNLRDRSWERFAGSWLSSKLKLGSMWISPYRYEGYHKYISGTLSRLT